MLIDLVGKRFGKLTVISKGITDKNSRLYWNCLCDCGNEVSKLGLLLRDGRTKSCGCLRSEYVSNKNKTHGMARTKMNMVWQEMKSRCRNPNHKRYSDYGGRGISYQESWEEFINFYNDMSDTYQDGLTLDRIDNDGDYTKENCRWSSYLSQNNNKRNCVYETVGGIRATRSQLADMFGIPRCTFYWRLSHGMTVEEALTTSKKQKTKKES